MRPVSHPGDGNRPVTGRSRIRTTHHHRRRDTCPAALPRASGLSGVFRLPGYVDPQAPYGRDQTTGLPLSDRSVTTAGLLQFFFGVFGVGRFYIDSTQIAVAQLCVGLFGVLFSLFCFVGLPVLLGSIVWAIVDAILIFTGNVKDNHGRKPR